MKLATLAIHAGQPPTPLHGGVTPDITLTTTFERDESGNLSPARPLYSRAANPNRTQVESKLNALEGGIDAFAFASGQAASMSIFHLFGGSHVLLPDDCYFATKALIEQVYGQRHLSFTAVDMTNLAAVEAAIRPETSLIWIETPSNPLLKITDIQAIVTLADKKNIAVVADNTWATPFFTQPLAWGVAAVVHSTTKYLGGHSDLLGGCVVLGPRAAHWQQPLRTYQQVGGAVPSPFDCWLLNRSLATFPIRMPVHAQNALQLAHFLQQHPRIEQVNYPGLPENTYHIIAKKQMAGGFGGMLSVQVAATEADTKKLASSLRFFKHATSLGGVESLIEQRRSVEGESSQSPPNLLRISCGIEDISDLIDDLTKALAAF